MPTDRPRHSITETAEIAAALKDAARVWPDSRDNRAELLRRLIEAGHAAVERRALIRPSAGAASGAFPPNAARMLRDEWPA